MGYKDIAKYDQAESFSSVLVNDGGKLRQIEKQKMISALGMGMITEITFKGSDTTENIQAKTADLGDKWYSSDENVYYLYTESGWVNVGSGEDYAKITEDVGELKSDIGDFDEAEVDGNNIIEMINNACNSGGGLSKSAKDALINCFNHVAWIDGNGASYVQTLQNALNASTTAKVVSISAVYSGGSVASGSELSALKENLVVTSTYDDGTEVAVTGYTLSGSVIEGENTITVTYRKVTATFTVTGLASYTITYNLTNVTSSSDILAVVTGEYYTTTLSYDSSLYDLQSVVVTMDGVDITSDVYGDGTILITEVTGDLVITAVANEPIINEAVLLQVGSTIKYYSTSDETALLVAQNYAWYILATEVATADSTAKITITNNTGDTVGKNGKIYVGQTKKYYENTSVCVYDSVLAYEVSSLGIEDGNSITFTANVKKDYKLICTGFAGCDIQVQNIITDPGYDTDTYTEYSKTKYSAGNSVQYYTDDGTTSLVNSYYGSYFVSDNVFEEDTEVIITCKNISTGSAGGAIYAGSILEENIGLSVVPVYYAEMLTNKGFVQYGYLMETYTVKAGHHLVLSYQDETAIETVFKTKN